jgi:single-stranded DNA-specific DHH superfamily exonuclease
MLAYALTRDQTSDFKKLIIDGLSRLGYPHRINGVHETALAHLEDVAEIIEIDRQVNISLRSKRGLDYHLGKITREIAEKMGGFGGGHKRASGASIPFSSLDEFIKMYDAQL